MLDIKTIEFILSEKIDLIRPILSDTRKPLVYTSFDGDYMQYMQHMMVYSLQNGYIPINPEATLGYYISTTTHDGDKVPVMMDCLKSMSICDRFWVFNPSNGHMPEGVLAEVIYWCRIKDMGIDIVPFFDNTITFLSAGIRKHRQLDLCQVNSFIDRNDKNMIREIENVLLTPYHNKGHKSAYIISNIKNIKHIDWGRVYCYRQNLCPLCPNTILPFYIHSLVYPNRSCLREYLNDRLSIMDKSDKLLLFINEFDLENELNKLDIYSLAELYYALSSNRMVEIVNWKDTKVPKYANPAKWALTSVERAEVNHA